MVSKGFQTYYWPASSAVQPTYPIIDQGAGYSFPSVGLGRSNQEK